MHQLYAPIARFLDQTTMYKVITYALFVIAFAALTLSVAGVLAVSPVALVASFIALTVGAMVAHSLCVRVTGAPGNIESSAITALILFLILTPVSDVRGLAILAGIGALAIVLKYVVQYRHRHLFNPVALALVVVGIAGPFFSYYGAEWWVGSRYLLPVVAIVGALVVAKTRRWPMVLLFIAVSTVTVLVYNVVEGGPVLLALSWHFLSWPTIFFAAFMLTEPLGLPSTHRDQYVYATIVAVVSSVPFHFGVLHGTPELALVVANLFTFVIDQPARLRLLLRERREVGANTYEYTFTPDGPVRFVPGQYLEWTLPHQQPDTRGIRRYFTIASAPHEETVSFAVRHVPESSSFKRVLTDAAPGTSLYAVGRAGDFTLRPNAPHHVWISGGIGVTPFISMMRAAAEGGTKLSATHFYCNKSATDVAFKEECEAAATSGIKTVHILQNGPGDGLEPHAIGFLTADVLKMHVPEWATATFYISGPPGLVNSYRTLLRSLGIPRRRIVTDYFPGLA